MSWYVMLNGRQVWVDREETVYTVGEPPEEELPLESLAYLSVSTQKAQYTEHIIDDETGGKTKKSKERTSGRQRGFVVRVDGDTRTRVTAPMQAAIDHLVTTGVASRIDVDDPQGQSKKKGKSGGGVGGGAPEEILPPLGANECRVEIVTRCQHVGHGKGYQVDVLQLGSRQKINIFVAEQDLKVPAFHKLLVEAVEAGGGKLALGRMVISPEDGGGKDGAAKPKKRDVAQEEDDDWLVSVMGRCMVPKKEEAAAAAGKAEQAEGADAGAAGAEGAAPTPAPKPKEKKNVPPWLRR